MLYEIGLLCTIVLGLWVLVDVAGALPRRLQALPMAPAGCLERPVGRRGAADHTRGASGGGPPGPAPALPRRGRPADRVGLDCRRRGAGPLARAHTLAGGSGSGAPGGDLRPPLHGGARLVRARHRVAARLRPALLGVRGASAGVSPRSEPATSWSRRFASARPARCGCSPSSSARRFRSWPTSST